MANSKIEIGPLRRGQISLLNAIYAYRIGEMEDRRAALLARAQVEGEIDSGVLLLIMCLPQLDLVDADGTHPYAGFMVQFAMRYWFDDEAHHWVDPREAAPCLESIIRMLIERLDWQPQELAMSRIVLCNEMFLHALVRWDNLERHNAPYDFATMIQRTLEAIEGAYFSTRNQEREHSWLFEEFASLRTSAV